MGSATSRTARALDTGWQADPDVIEASERAHPGFVFREEQVPDYQLPDPLRGSDGSVVDRPAAWRGRRREILELFRTQVYGRRPAAAVEVDFDLLQEDTEAMAGAATLRRIEITSVHRRRTHRFELILFLPNAASGPVPVFLLMNNRGPENTDPTRQHRSEFWPAEHVIDRGYGIAALQVSELAPDDPDTYRDGVIRLFEGSSGGREPDSWAALAAWGWGASRAMDYLGTDRRVDDALVALVGHSRGGKASLWAGAEDQRFGLVVSNESGCGGAALSRRRFGETLTAINSAFPHWFCANFDRYNDDEDSLPVDQHMLISLLAPRPVYVTNADEDLWADPRGSFLALAHSGPVYRLWDAPTIGPNEMPPLSRPLVRGPHGYHIRPGGHGMTLVDWEHFLDFADSVWP